MSDEDLASLIAFLRSDDPVLQAEAVNVPPTQWTALGKVFVRWIVKPAPYPEEPILAPPPSDRVAYGKYLVQDLAACFACHSGGFARLDRGAPERSKGYLAGGTAMKDLAGSPIVASNLTPDDETGIGRWSEQDFVRVLREGIRRDNTPVRFPMRPYAEFSEEEAKAIFAYLKTVPAIRNPRSVSATMPRVESRGAALYQKYGCRSCHGDDGAGLGDLRRASERFATDAELEAWIRSPSRIRPGTKMPDFEGVIPTEDFPALIQHVRSLGQATRPKDG